MRERKNRNRFWRMILCLVMVTGGGLALSWIPVSWGGDVDSVVRGQYETPLLIEDEVHDPDNEGIKLLQEPREILFDLPRDRLGKIHWVAALNQGVISPRKDLSDKAKTDMPELDLDILMTNTASMPHVRFPHKAHTQWLACSNCHPDIFVQKQGANAISMSKILEGEFCGRCHGKVAFSWFACERCHSVPHASSPPAWW